MQSNLPRHATSYSSPLKRCSELAKSLWPNSTSIIFESRLMELNFGAWEGQQWDSINRNALDDWAKSPLNFSPPMGENYRMLIGRVAQWKREAIQYAVAINVNSVVAVTHAGVIRAMHLLTSGLSVSQSLSLNVGHGEIYRF